MTFDIDWDDALSDPTSQAYQDAIKKANDALRKMTGWGDDVDLSSVKWTFTEGSVVAKATVTVVGGGSAADLAAKLNDFDVSTIEGLAGVSAKGKTIIF